MTTIPNDIKLIIDFTLGDGYLSINNNTEYPKFRCEHSIKQLEYCNHKNKLLIESGYKTNYRIYTSTTKKNYGRKYCRIDIYGDHRLKTARKYLYNKKVKTIDKKLLKQLDDKSLAYLFMDDGSVKTINYSLNGNIKYLYEKRKAHSYKLSTNCFSLEENELLKDWLYTEFNIYSTISKSPSNSGVYLYIARTEDKDRFRDLVKPYIIESMEYKISYPHSFIGMSYKSIPRERREETERNDIQKDDATVQDYQKVV